ncbi:MAG: hypothetical protein WCH07_04355 [Deltaproteobacteria bacterium]
MEKYPYLSDIQRSHIESALTKLRVDDCHHDKIMNICDIYLSQKEWQLSFSTKRRDDHTVELKGKHRQQKDKPLPPVSSQEARAEVKRLKELCDEFEETAVKGLTNFLMIHSMDAPPSLQEAIHAVKKLNSELQNTIKDLSGQAGRSTNIARNNLISHLAGAYEACFGKKPGYPNPSGSDGNPNGPFFRFVCNLITILDGKELNLSTLNTNIRRALDNINRVRLSNGSLGARHGKKVYHLAVECYHIHNEIPDEA